MLREMSNAKFRELVEAVYQEANRRASIITDARAMLSERELATLDVHTIEALMRRMGVSYNEAKELVDEIQNNVCRDGSQKQETRPG